MSNPETYTSAARPDRRQDVLGLVSAESGRFGTGRFATRISVVVRDDQSQAVSEQVGFFDPSCLRWHDLQDVTETGEPDRRMAFQVCLDYGAPWADAAKGDAPFTQSESITSSNRTTRFADAEGRVSPGTSLFVLRGSEDDRFAVSLTCDTYGFLGEPGDLPSLTSTVSEKTVDVTTLNADGTISDAFLRAQKQLEADGFSVTGVDALGGGRVRLRASDGGSVFINGREVDAKTGRSDFTGTVASDIISPGDMPHGYLWSRNTTHVGTLGTVFAPEAVLDQYAVGPDGTRIAHLPIRHDAHHVLTGDAAEYVLGLVSGEATAVTGGSQSKATPKKAGDDANPFDLRTGRIVFTADDVSKIPLSKGKVFWGVMASNPKRADANTKIGNENTEWVPAIPVDLKIPPTETPPDKPDIPGIPGKNGKDGKDGNDGKPGAGGGGAGDKDKKKGDDGKGKPDADQRRNFDADGVPCPNKGIIPIFPGEDDLFRKHGGDLPKDFRKGGGSNDAENVVVPTPGADGIASGSPSRRKRISRKKRDTGHPTVLPTAGGWLVGDHFVPSIPGDDGTRAYAGSRGTAYTTGSMIPPQIGSEGGPATLEGWTYMMSAWAQSTSAILNGAFGGPRYFAGNMAVVHRNDDDNPPAASRIGAWWTAAQGERLKIAESPIQFVAKLDTEAGGKVDATTDTDSDDNPTTSCFVFGRENHGSVDDDRPLLYLDNTFNDGDETDAPYIQNDGGTFVVDSGGNVTSGGEPVVTIPTSATDGTVPTVAVDDAGNKTIEYTTPGGGSTPPFNDDTAILQDSGDTTKKVIIDAGSITTGTTRTLTVPDNNGMVAAITGTPAAGEIPYAASSTTTSKISAGTTNKYLRGGTSPAFVDLPVRQTNRVQPTGDVTATTPTTFTAITGMSVSLFSASDSTKIYVTVSVGFICTAAALVYIQAKADSTVIGGGGLAIANANDPGTITFTSSFSPTASTSYSFTAEWKASAGNLTCNPTSSPGEQQKSIVVVEVDT